MGRVPLHFPRTNCPANAAGRAMQGFAPLRCCVLLRTVARGHTLTIPHANSVTYMVNRFYYLNLW